MPLTTVTRRTCGKERGGLWHLVSAGVVAGSVVVASPALADPGVASGSPAVAVRNLQTMLMVAALTCDARKQYNAFVLKFRPALAEHGHALKRQFSKRFGAAGHKQLNAYVTALANEKSLEASRDRAGFCARSAALFTSASTTEAGGIGHLAASTTSGAVIEEVVAATK